VFLANEPQKGNNNLQGKNRIIKKTAEAEHSGQLLYAVACFVGIAEQPCAANPPARLCEGH